MLFYIIPTTYLFCFIFISVILPLIMFLLRIKYTIINIIILIFCFSIEYFLGVFIYTERGVPSGEEIVIINSLSKYEDFIITVEFLILTLLFTNFIYAIIFSIRWLKHNNI
jgi:hypothetical protein